MAGETGNRKQYIKTKFKKFYDYTKQVLYFFWVVTFGEAIALTPLRILMAFLAGAFISLAVGAPIAVFVGMVLAAVIFGALRWGLEKYKEAQEAKLNSIDFAKQRVDADAALFKSTANFQLNQAELQGLADELFGTNCYEVVATKENLRVLTLHRKMADADDKASSKKAEEIVPDTKKADRQHFADLIKEQHPNEDLAKDFDPYSHVLENGKALRLLVRGSKFLRLLKHLWTFLNRYSMYFWWMMMISMTLFCTGIAVTHPLFVLLIPAIFPGIFLIKQIVKVLTKPQETDADVAAEKLDNQRKQDWQLLLQEWTQRQHVKHLKSLHATYQTQLDNLRDYKDKLQKHFGFILTPQAKKPEIPLTAPKLTAPIRNLLARLIDYLIKDIIDYLIKGLTGFGLGYLFGCFIPWPFLVIAYLLGASWVLTPAVTVALFSFAAVVGLFYMTQNLYGVHKNKRARDEKLYTTRIEIPGLENKPLLSDYANALQQAMQTRRVTIKALRDKLAQAIKQHSALLEHYYRKQTRPENYNKSDKLDLTKLSIERFNALLANPYVMPQVDVTTLDNHSKHTGLSWLKVGLIEAIIKAIDGMGTGMFFVRSVLIPGMTLTLLIALNLSTVFHIALIMGGIWVGVKLAELYLDYRQRLETEMLNSLESRVRTLENEYKITGELQEDLEAAHKEVFEMNQQLEFVHDSTTQIFNWKNSLAMKREDPNQKWGSYQPVALTT